MKRATKILYMSDLERDSVVAQHGEEVMEAVLLGGMKVQETSRSDLATAVQ